MERSDSWQGRIRIGFPQNFDPSRSQNSYVNGTLVYRFVWGDPLCVQCGTTGHLPRRCTGTQLSEDEQKYLYKLMREEQNRSKAERGYDRRQPTSSLNPRPVADWEARRPFMRDVIQGVSGSSNSLRWPVQENRMSHGHFDIITKSEHRKRFRVIPPSHWKDHDATTTGCTKIHNTDEAVDSQIEIQSEDWAKVKAAGRDEPIDVTCSDVIPTRLKFDTANASTSNTALVPTVASARSLVMGATKRLSNGEAKSVGPHPSAINVSASYITHQAIEKRLQPSALDVQERSLAEAREDNVRLQGVTWLDNVRRALQLPVKTYTTACVYYHKFRLAHPAVEYNYTDAAAASLLTSCKNEDTLKKSRDILAAAYNLKQPSTHEQAGADDPIFDASSRVVIGLERLVLESGGFDFRSRSPHHTLIKISKSLNASEDLRIVSQLAWTILTDMHRTFAVLKQTSSTLALASLQLAADFVAATSINNECTVKEDLQRLDLSTWHSTREEIMETLLDALDLYTHHTASTILGTKYSLDDLLRIRLTLNKECSESNLPRHTVVQPPPSPDDTQGSSHTLRVSNGHPTPVSPPQPGTQASQQPNGASQNILLPEGGGTLRFMLNPQRATDERAEVNRYYNEEWEEYEEEIEVPILGHRSRDRDHDRRRDRPERLLDDRHSSRDGRDGPPRTALERDRDRERLREREREAEHDRARLRDRDRERRYDDRRYDARERDRRYDDRRDRDRDRGGRYYDDDRRRPRDDRR